MGRTIAYCRVSARDQNPQPAGPPDGRRPRPPRHSVPDPQDRVDDGRRDPAQCPPGGRAARTRAARPAGRSPSALAVGGIGAGTVAPPTALGLSHPVLGVVLALAEVVEAATLILVFGLPVPIAILRGSEATSERCFRLLRLIGDRPEHPAPPRAAPGGHESAAGMNGPPTGAEVHTGQRSK